MLNDEIVLVMYTGTWLFLIEPAVQTDSGPYLASGAIDFLH